MAATYSIHSIDEAKAPTWLPGEQLAAAAFIAMTFLLVLEINIQIHYVFRKRKGVYFWAMQIGSLGCAVDGLGLLIRYLIPNAVLIWPLYTLTSTVGWAVYTVSQLTVLNSRLYLVLQNSPIQRAVSYAIAIVSPILILTDWTTTWPAYNPKTSDQWSPAEAVVERICQFGFSTLEITINVIYAIAITRLLRCRVNVRQRRVMQDLIYVNVLAALLDILNICLVYVNRIGISHPIQTFSYAAKLRVEFIVLNQLTAVAGNGFPRGRFEEKRYCWVSGRDQEWNVGKPLREGSEDGICGTCLQTTRKKFVPMAKPRTLIPEPIFLSVPGSANVPKLSDPGSHYPNYQSKSTKAAP